MPPGFKGPLQRVLDLRQHRGRARSIGAMLAQGASQPWQDTLQKLTGTREMDASAIIEYFKPLRGWLEGTEQGPELRLVTE